MPSADEIRAAQRQTWDKFSGGWEKWDEVVLNTVGSVADAIIANLALRDDQVHLDVASGTGEPGLTIAAKAPRGHVTLTDLSPEMLAVAQRRAARMGITNVSFQECGAEDLPFPDTTFDSVSCRFAFMFVPDVTKAIAEFMRVAKPGGRVCTAVWAGPEHNPWTTLPMAAVSSEVQLPPPDPDGPGMFRWAQPGLLS
ncbi:MAG TPA: methyltransferase domain-containing protein, partial [Acidimicrobiales bacterium]|nr:methyltransferase domain-containing protein [Acidimicrobiales bacterium]